MPHQAERPCASLSKHLRQVTGVTGKRFMAHGTHVELYGQRVGSLGREDCIPWG